MRVRLIAMLLLLAAPAAACIWDYDTLRDEQRGLPDVAAVLVGKVERHSDFFYEQRIERMREHLAEQPDDLDAIDNLAVAHEKLGDFDRAIDLLTPIVEANPERYTALANLGTFHLHRYLKHGSSADLNIGITFIERAIEVNPDAHFGREKYQLALAEHIRDGKPGSFVMPMLLGPRYDELLNEPEELARVMEGVLRGRNVSGDEIDQAVAGIVGMIRFGTGTSPHLFEALGDLLAARGDKHLAVRSYLRARELGQAEAGDIDALLEQIHGEPSEADVAADLAKERQQADAWVTAFRSYEDDLIRQGGNPTEAGFYDAFYEQQGLAEMELGFAIEDHVPRSPANRLALLVLTGGVMLVIGLVLLRLSLAYRRAARQALTPTTTAPAAGDRA